jgi:hypothetical protein
MPVEVEGARQGSKYRRWPLLPVRWRWKRASIKRRSNRLKVEPAEVKAKIMALKQPGAPRPGEPHPSPKWQPNTELPLNMEERLISAWVEQLRGGVAEGKAAQLQLVGKLGHVI